MSHLPLPTETDGSLLIRNNGEEWSLQRWSYSTYNLSQAVSLCLVIGKLCCKAYYETIFPLSHSVLHNHPNASRIKLKKVSQHCRQWLALRLWKWVLGLCGVWLEVFVELQKTNIWIDSQQEAPKGDRGRKPGWGVQSLEVKSIDKW